MSFQSNELETFRLLISKGADLEARNSDGSTPLAMCSCHIGTRELTIWAIILLDHGANANPLDCDGDTPLNNAIFHQSEAIVKLLLQRGAAVDRLNNNGDSLLHWMARYSNMEILRIIDAANLRNVDTEAINKQGRTARQEAEEREPKPEGFLEKFDEILANIRARNQLSESAVDISTDRDHFNEVEEGFIDAVEQQ